MEELTFDRVPSGGAGNKMLMLLEVCVCVCTLTRSCHARARAQQRKAAAYIQDRGVSRWDTCAAQAVLEATGGVLCKLSTFMRTQELASYQCGHACACDALISGLTREPTATRRRCTISTLSQAWRS
jgi:fructose-1,6-bisphosphatase/inositol monophosphatase family enzyme